MHDKTNNSNNNTKRIKEKTGKTNLRFNSKSHSIPKFALELDIQLEVSSFHKRCNASVHADKSENSSEMENNDEKNAKADENGNKSGWATLDSEVRGYAELCNC